MVAMENPTCIARLSKFKVVAVATQCRFHHIQHLNDRRTMLLSRTQCKMAGVCPQCVLLLQQNVCIFTVVMEVSVE